VRLVSGAIEFTLSIEGYQYPHLETEPYDSNWLNVRIDVEHPDGAWTAIDPALLTYEGTALIEWLERAAQPGSQAGEIQFMEPCLIFRHVPEESLLRVCLECGFRPQRLSESAVPMWEFCLDFSVSPEVLRGCAKSLARALGPYPRRGRR